MPGCPRCASTPSRRRRSGASRSVRGPVGSVFRVDQSDPLESEPMPSPFPGMDPYLEAPGIWPDFHERLANQTSGQLNRELPAPYYAKLEVRLETGIVEEEEGRHRIVPDVAVVRRPRPPAPGALQTQDAP